MRRFDRTVLCLILLVLLLLPAVASAAWSDPDSSFGTGGRSTLSTTFGATAAEAVVQTPDGKLATAGSVTTNFGGRPRQDWVVGRVNADGSPDTTFRSSGLSQPLLLQSSDSSISGLGTAGAGTTAEFPPETTARGATALAVLPNGDMLVTGQTSISASLTDAPLVVVKVKGSGSSGQGAVDTSWASSGFAHLSLGSTRTTAEAIAVGADGLIYVTGHAFINAGETPFVARFNADGTPDTTFSANSFNATTSTHAAFQLACGTDSCDANALAVQSSGATVPGVLAGGWDASSNGGRVWRLVPGSGGFNLDTSYGSLGFASLNQYTNVDNIQAMVLGADGSLTVAGEAQNSSSTGPPTRCAFTHLTATGTADTNGSVSVDRGCVVRDLAANGDRTFTFAGTAVDGTYNVHPVLGHATAALAQDAAFLVSEGSTAGETAAALTLLAGKPVSAGQTGSPSTILLERFTGPGTGAPPALTPTRTSLESTQNPINSGASLRYIATVTPRAATGTVAFADGGKPIAGCGAVDVTNGTAQCIDNPTGTGQHSITAAYSGDATHAASTSPVLVETVVAPGAGDVPPEPSRVPLVFVSGKPVAKLVAGQTGHCQSIYFSGVPDPTLSFFWQAHPRNPRAHKVLLARTQALTITRNMVRGYSEVGCIVLASNRAGQAAAYTDWVQLARNQVMPNVSGKRIGQAKTIIERSLGGLIIYAAERDRGYPKSSIPCRFGGTLHDGPCHHHAGKIRPGAVWSTSPHIGYRFNARGDRDEIVVDFSYYDPALDKGDQLPAPKPTHEYGQDCPFVHGTDHERQALENDVLGARSLDAARALLSKYECRFVEETKKFVGNGVSWISGVREENRRIDDPQHPGHDIYQDVTVLTVSVPKAPDLAVTPYHLRLHGLDSFQGANLERGPVDPGLGTDGRLTADLSQDNDICWLVNEISTGRMLESVAISGTNPDGSPIGRISFAGNRPINAHTDSQGQTCFQFSVRVPGAYHFHFVYGGANGVSEEGDLTIEAVDRGAAQWTTIDGRQMRCSAAECDQLGFAPSQAHEASLVDDLAAVLKAILSHFTNAPAAQQALSSGGPTASLYAGHAKGGVTPGFLAAASGGTLKPSLTPAPIVAQGGGNIVAQGGGNIVAQGGGNLRPVTSPGIVATGGGNIVATGGGNIGAAGKLGAVPGATIVSTNGSNAVAGAATGIVAQGGGNVMQIEGQDVIVDRSGHLPAGMLISQDGSGLISQDGSGVIPAVGPGLIGQDGSGLAARAAPA